MQCKKMYKEEPNGNAANSHPSKDVLSPRSMAIPPATGQFPSAMLSSSVPDPSATDNCRNRKSPPVPGLRILPILASPGDDPKESRLSYSAREDSSHRDASSPQESLTWRKASRPMDKFKLRSPRDLARRFLGRTKSQPLPPEEGSRVNASPPRSQRVPHNSPNTSEQTVQGAASTVAPVVWLPPVPAEQTRPLQTR